ncbi:hypothetical protein BC826DRAFT_254725 [Russula brevipes]|nr:hypothetical protein BC826DRAFT_254725 [Russula brevipes]
MAAPSLSIPSLLPMSLCGPRRCSRFLTPLRVPAGLPAPSHRCVSPLDFPLRLSTSSSGRFCRTRARLGSGRCRRVRSITTHGTADAPEMHAGWHDPCGIPAFAAAAEAQKIQAAMSAYRLSASGLHMPFGFPSGRTRYCFIVPPALPPVH